MTHFRRPNKSADVQYASLSLAGKMPALLLLPLLILSLFPGISGCSPKPDLIWKFKTGAAVYSSPSIAGDTVVIGSNDHHLYALNRTDGKVIWKTNLGDRILMKPLVEGDNIYVGTASGYFYQVRSQNGSTGWKFNAKAMLEFDVCADTDGIYFGSYDKNFYKINRHGALLWAYETGSQLSSSCIFYKDLVLTTSWDAYIYAFKRNSGELVWKHHTAKINYGNGALVGDSFYFSTHNTLYCLHAATGKVLFQKKIPYNTYILAHNKALFTQENGVTRRSLDGTVTKNLRVNSFAEFPPSLAGDLILVSDTKNQLLAVSPELETKWKFEADKIFWTPGVFHDGVYYVGNRDSYVYALKLPT